MHGPTHPQFKKSLTLKLVRHNCLECSGGSMRAVTWCPCDGVHSTRCELWLFRLGSLPATFRAKYGARLLDPALMPPENVNLDDLPSSLAEAATGEIDIPGYHQPAVEVAKSKPKRKYTAEERRAIGKRLKDARKTEPEGKGDQTRDDLD